MNKEELRKEVDRQSYETLGFYRWVDKQVISYACGKITEEDFDSVLGAIRTRAENMRGLFDKNPKTKSLVSDVIG